MHDLWTGGLQTIRENWRKQEGVRGKRRAKLCSYRNQGSKSKSSIFFHSATRISCYLTRTFVVIAGCSLDPVPSARLSTVRRHWAVTEPMSGFRSSSTNPRAIGPLRPHSPAAIAGLFFCKLNDAKMGKLPAIGFVYTRRKHR